MDDLKDWWNGDEGGEDEQAEEQGEAEVVEGDDEQKAEEDGEEE